MSLLKTSPVINVCVLYAYQKMSRSWSREEDAKIMCRMSDSDTCYKWALIAFDLPGRSGKQVRERWTNQLNPQIKTSAWTEDEDSIVIQARSKVTLYIIRPLTAFGAVNFPC